MGSEVEDDLGNKKDNFPNKSPLECKVRAQLILTLKDSRMMESETQAI